VSISEQNIEIRYFAPWQKNVSVNVADIVRVDYEKGNYSAAKLAIKESA